MITEPALHAGKPFPAELADRLADEAMQGEGLMPLLQFSLRELWAARVQRDTWPPMKGIAQRFAETSSQVLERLGPADREVARRVFLALVVLGPEGRWLRRRRLKSELGGRKDPPECPHPTAP